MEDLLARELVAEQYAQQVLNPDFSIETLLQAFDDYRQICESCIFADITQAEHHEARLWQAHTEARKYLHKVLSSFRKQGESKVVATRQVTAGFRLFIKGSQTFYRSYILNLNNAFGGIPELQAVAHKVKPEVAEQTVSASFPRELHDIIVAACHRTLVYLGDLSRYRTTEKLDKRTDFGPAIGYYALACTLCPHSGMGHHQQAVVALEQREHLRAIYHLYRAMVVRDPHPNALKNLRVEFEKTNAAWDRGDLIQKGPPNDPEAPKRALVGWFVRLHSMCYKGQHFRGFDELERELLGQFSANLKQGALGNTLHRMLMTNLAAQFHASENFQAESTNEHQDAFLFFFRINVRFFTVLLTAFADAVVAVLPISGQLDEDLPLDARLAPESYYLLPALRLYSSWLLSNTHLVMGLASDEFVKAAVDEMWPAYGRVVDLIAAVFPIWDLDDLPEVHYMLEEDVETIGFKPLEHPRTAKLWSMRSTGALRSRYTDADVKRQSESDEMLTRVRDFVSDGAFLANDTDETPLGLRGTRIVYQCRLFDLPAALRPSDTSAPSVVVPDRQNTKLAKPLSYAAAAKAGPSIMTNGVGKSAAQKVAQKPSRPSPSGLDSATPLTTNTARQAQLSRMVDDLVDDDDVDNPVTPPQLHMSSPAVINNGDATYNAMQDSVHELGLPNYAVTKGTVHRPVVSPAVHTPKMAASHIVDERMQPVPGIWENRLAQPVSSSSQFPSGLPIGTMTPPAQSTPLRHSRVNSASSIRSKASPTLGDSWHVYDGMARQGNANVIPGLGVASDSYRKFSHSGLASPMLFGTGGIPWGSAAAQHFQSTSPPSGQPG